MHWLSDLRQALTQLPPTFVAALEPDVAQVMTTCYSCKSLHALAIGTQHMLGWHHPTKTRYTKFNHVSQPNGDVQMPLYNFLCDTQLYHSSQPQLYPEFLF